MFFHAFLVNSPGSATFFHFPFLFSILLLPLPLFGSVCCQFLSRLVLVYFILFLVYLQFTLYLWLSHKLNKSAHTVPTTLRFALFLFDDDQHSVLCVCVRFPLRLFFFLVNFKQNFALATESSEKVVLGKNQQTAIFVLVPIELRFTFIIFTAAAVSSFLLPSVKGNFGGRSITSKQNY